jgi:hypothetical protein
LRRRNAEAVERQRPRGGPAHQALFEQGRERGAVELALLVERAGVQQLARIDAVDACDEMADADRGAEQAVAVHVAREHADALTAEAEEAAPLPVAARVGIEMGSEMAPIGVDV